MSSLREMQEDISSENLVHNIVDMVVEGMATPVPGTLSEEKEKSSSDSSEKSVSLGLEKPVHALEGDKSGDIMVGSNKKISAGSLVGATLVWALFEWLNYHLVSLLCFALAFGMIALFIWSNAPGFLNRTLPDQVPQLAIPEEIFVDVAKKVGDQVNRILEYLQDVASGGDAKKFLIVVSSLFGAAVISSWCNFMTVVYIGFIAAHTLPILYERYQNRVDGVVCNVLEEFRNHYQKLNTNVLRRAPATGKKDD